MNFVDQTCFNIIFTFHFTQIIDSLQPFVPSYHIESLKCNVIVVPVILGHLSESPKYCYKKK